jgi:hypothetical protein
MKKIILLSVIYSIFFGCKKEEKPDYPYLEMPDEVWDYIRLSLGSWYIYKDSASGVTDSVEVTYIELQKRKPRYFGPQPHYYDEYTFALDKVDLSGNKTLWLYANSSTNMSLADPNLSYWLYQDSLVLMQYPSNLPGSPSIYKIPSATIEGNVYADIMVVASNAGVVWWAKGIGIVKLSRFVNGNIQTSLLLRKK